MRKLRVVTAILLALGAAAALAGGGGAPSGMTPKSAIIPQTPEEHIAMAKQYDQKAAMWRDEAAYHRGLAAEYKKFSRTPNNPHVAKMEKHCNAIATEADKLAVEADAMAKEHRQVAAEAERK